MKFQLIQQSSARRLLLIFAGWGMDVNPFSNLRLDGYDLGVVWDYTDESILPDIPSVYDEVVVLAWSMGVFEAERILPALCLPVTLSVAVNGTPYPVDDRKGIPIKIFNTTLATLSEASLVKFNRRMCGSASTLAAFNEVKPERSVDSLRAELQAIGQRALAHSTTGYRWDIAVIGNADMIFPADCQRAAWGNNEIIEIPTPHLPDFQQIINSLIINKDLVAKRFSATRDGYSKEASFQHSVGRELIKHFNSFSPSRHFTKAIEIGAGTGILTEEYLPDYSFDSLELWDIAPIKPYSYLPAWVATIQDDAESRLKKIPDGYADCIISASTLQWFNSPIGGIKEIERILRPGGIAVISLYVAGTYASLAAELGTSLHYVTPNAVTSALTVSQILYSSVSEEAITFNSTTELLRHISSTGVNAAGSISTATLRRTMTANQLRTLEYVTLYLIFKRL